MGCTRDATQLVAVIGSDLPADDIRTVRIRVWPIDDANPTVEGREPTAEQRFEVGPMTDGVRVGLPFSFGVLPPRGTDEPRIEMQTDALDAMSQVTVSRSTRVGFVREQTLRLPVYLSALCRGVMCPPGQTCIEGTCSSNEVDASSLDPVTAGAELLDGGSPPDVDAGTTPIPDMVAPTFAIGTGTTQSFGGASISFLGDTGDLFLYGKGPDPIGPMATGVAGFGMLVARYGPDGTQRWIRRWVLPDTATELDLQGNSVADSVLAGDVIYACGVLSSLGLTERDGATPLRTFAATGRTMGDDTWLAQLDAATGAIRAVSIIAFDPTVTESDAWCRGLRLTSAGLVIAMQVGNPAFGPIEPTAFLLDGVPIPSSGPTGAAEGGVLLVQPTPTGFNGVSARHFRGTLSAFVSGPGETSWMTLEGTSSDIGGLLASEPSPPAGAIQSVLAVQIDGTGAPMAVHPLVHTNEQFSRAALAEGGGRLFVASLVEERTTAEPSWIEVVGRARVEGVDTLAGYRSALAFVELDPTDGAMVRAFDALPIAPGATLAMDVDDGGNLYIGTRYNDGSEIPPLGLSAATVQGRSDAYLVRYDVTDAGVTPRWTLVFSDTTGEATFGDGITGLEVSSGGRLAIAGTTSMAGLDLGLGTMPSGHWYALLQ